MHDKAVNYVIIINSILLHFSSWKERSLIWYFVIVAEFDKRSGVESLSQSFGKPLKRKICLRTMALKNLRNNVKFREAWMLKYFHKFFKSQLVLEVVGQVGKESEVIEIDVLTLKSCKPCEWHTIIYFFHEYTF